MELEQDNKLDHSKVLWANDAAVRSQEFHSVLLYTGGDESGRPLEISPKLKKFDLASKKLIDFHFETLYKNGLFDVIIVTYKDIANQIKKHPLPEHMTSKMNIKIYVLREMEDSTVTAMRLISSDLTKSLIIIHGQYMLDMDLKDAIAVHKINDSDMTLVLKKEDELVERIRKGSPMEQFNIYGLGKKRFGVKNTLPVLKNSYELYSMFNSFEAADQAGLSVKKSLLEKCPSASITLRADLCDTGVYIMRDLFKDKSLAIQTIDFDLVKLMVNNQFKKKLLRFIAKGSTDEDTREIDELLDSEIGQPEKAVIMAWVKSSSEDIAVDMNVLNSQNDSDDEMENNEEGAKDSMLLDDSD